MTRAVLVALEELSSPAWKPIFIAARPCGVASGLARTTSPNVNMNMNVNVNNAGGVCGCG